MKKLYPPNRRAARRLAASCVFENLELRSLMSVVNVADYGARPNDGVNDLAAIKAAMSASKAGDTILFDGGTFDLSGFGSGSGGNGLVVSSNRTYKGQNGATLRGHDTNGPQIHVNGDGVTFSNLNFNGGGLFFDKPGGGYNTNITVDSNEFHLDTGGKNNNAITSTSGFRNSTISNNLFTANNYHGTFGIYGYGRDHLTVRNNEFINISAGIHMESFNANDADTVFEQNYFSGVRGMGIELQRYGLRTIIQDNWYEHPTLSSDFSKNTYSMAYSLILERSTDTIARRNVVIAPERPDGTGTRIGIEIGGDNALVEDNYMNWVNHTIAANDGTGTTSVTVRNNKLMNYLQGVGIAFRSTNPLRTMTATNNGANVTLSSTMEQRIAANDKPGIGSKRYDGTGSNTTPPPTSTPDPTPTPIPDNSLPDVPVEADVTYLSDIEWASMVNGWGSAERNLSNGEKATGDGKRLAINGVTFAKGLGVHAGSEIHYNLAGQYARFKSEIGMDDEVGSKGSVVFQVYFDGTLVYDSTKLTGDSSWQFLDIDVSNVQDLGLVVTDGGDGKNFDHADWGAARLTKAPPPGQTVVNLSSLIPDSQSNGWGVIELDASNGEKGVDGKTLTLNGVTYDTGIGVHANSTLVFNLNGQYTSFKSDVGVDDEVGSKGSVQFTVIVDGTTAFDSGVMTGASDTKSVDVDVTGKQQLQLVVTSPTSNIDFDHGDWAGAILTANA